MSLTARKITAPTTRSRRTVSPRPSKEPDESRYRGRLGAAVRARRESLGLTIPELVERLAVQGVAITDQALYAYECGRRPVGVDDLPAFAAALKTTIRRLMPEA